MKFLITGSSGFIGHHLVKQLLSDGHEVVGIDNHNDYYDISLKRHREESLISNKYKFYLQDINTISIDDKNFDIAIHLAAQAGVRVPADKEFLYEHSNIKGFKAFCNFCKEKQIGKVIYASSSSVYSDLNQGKFNEEHSALNPKSKYGLSKLSNENFASEFSEKFNIAFVGLRFFSVYGPLGRPDMAYYLFTELLKKRSCISLINNGLMSRDMTFIDDITNGILGAIKFLCENSNSIRNEIFNLGNDNPISTIKLLETIESKLNLKSEINHMYSKNESNFTHADISKAKNLLGYVPKIDFDHGMDRFLNWHNSYKK